MVPQLTRLMVIFGLLLILYFVVRWIAKPDSFYWYGHYRGEALAEVADLPVHYAPRDACFDCHAEQAAENRAGPHKSISCQSCHDAGQAHVDDPSTDNITRPVPAELCVICHAAGSARPASFPQIQVAEHAMGMSCIDCHVTHNPGEFQ